VDNICITFGAGISAGYVPTLIEFFAVLGIEKVVYEDCATDDYLKKFIVDLYNDSEKQLNLVQETWNKVKPGNIHSTPTRHYRNKGLCVILRHYVG
jgi:hypothetical protein